ncbi:MAG: hypothetical protein WD768_07800 [Phycisphaeraceae bacterium]
MQSRNLRILMLGFLALWFGMILPGHERGVIQLPGYAAAPGSDQASDCATQSSCSSCCPTQSSGGKSDSSKNRAPGHCAICYLLGVLDVPVTIAFTLPDPQLLDCLSPAMCQSIASVASLDITRERGPPLL